MNTEVRNRRLITCLAWVLLAVIFVDTSFAQSENKPSDLLSYGKTNTQRAGSGYMVAGDSWVTLHPVNMAEPNRMRSIFAGIGYNYIMMLGSTGNWREPAGSWPSGYPWTNHFRNSPLIWSAVYDKDGWAGYAPGNRLRDLDRTVDDQGTGGTSRFMFPAWGADVAGAGDPARDYKRDARYTDASRTHLVYEAGWPTTAGLDYKIRLHQYSSNEQNLNDFVALEISITNTGRVDSDGDGTIDETGNKVDGIVFNIAGDVTPSILIGTNGDRGGNKLLAGRTFGYVASLDRTGAPYDFFAWFANVPPRATTNRSTPPPGERSFGIDNTNDLLGYTDVWNAWAWVGTKRGSIEDGNIGAITASSPDKSTVFGSHSTGEGRSRGWYNSSHWQAALTNRRNSDLSFRNGMATWYEDYGKLSNGGDVPVNLNPNSRFFATGEPDKIETWVVGNPDARPNGDLKYGHEDVGTRFAVEQPIWEAEWNVGAASEDFYNGVEGWSKEYTFGQAPQHMHGPFSLEVGESMTTVFVQATGFRMEGVSDGIKAARWAWERGWDISADMPTPAAPEMKPISTPIGSALIAWTDVSDLGPVDGYKIWKASQLKQTKYLDAGMRAVDNYHHQHQPEEGRDAFLDPVNPNFDVGDPDVFFAGDIRGVYQPAEWGTYDLLANIPVGDLSLYSSGVPSGYDYAFEDTEVITEAAYWYYVSAYRNGSFSGPQGPVAVNHIESANFNRNGRNDPSSPDGRIGLGTLWAGTYPYAYRNEDFPASGTQELKNIGAPFGAIPELVSRTVEVSTLDDDFVRNGNCTLREAAVVVNTGQSVDACLAFPETRIIDLTHLSGTIKLLGGPLTFERRTSLVGPGRDVLTIDGDHRSRVIIAKQGSNVSISSVTITNGFSGDFGGAILNEGFISLDDVLVTSSEARFGGGISSSGLIAIKGSTIASNRASLGGGLHATEGTVETSVIQSNIASGGGGGIFKSNGDNLRLLDTSVIENTAEVGGGIFVEKDSLFLVRSHIAGNLSNTDGGGIFLSEHLFEHSVVVVESSTIDGNLAGRDGGGISAVGALAIIVKSTVSDNVAVERGGGLRTGLVATTIISSTISGNSARVGGGVFNDQSGIDISHSTISVNNADTAGGVYSVGPVALFSSIVAANVVTSAHPELLVLRDGIASSGYNLVGLFTGSNFGFNAGDQVGFAGSPLNPFLAPLAWNKGPTKTHALLDESPAIDAGYCPGVRTDQRGLGSRNPPRRIVDVAGVANIADGCDIGSYEFDPDGILVGTERVVHPAQSTPSLSVVGPYPQPSSQLTSLLIVTEETQRVGLEVFDVLGRKVSISQSLDLIGGAPEVVKINVSRLAPGVYYVLVQGRNASTTLPLIRVQ